MVKTAGAAQVAKAILSNPRILMVKPSVNLFLYEYLKKFRVLDVDGNLVIHSHLPPINSRAYGRFIREHLLDKNAGPSHAQIGITNACPQDCAYCYNRNRTGAVMDTGTILRAIDDLKKMGVFWIGLTGGEPLLNRNLETIIERIGDDCASKLFTTGSTLTMERAAGLRDAGLFSVSVSLDHWKEHEHDRARNTKGAFRTALKAIGTFREVGRVHVGVSAVLSKDMLKPDIVEEYLAFLMSLGVHEAWLSEAKPSTAEFSRQDLIITPDEREMLISLQDKYNAEGKMTVNYLGHFEDKRHFGCAAGHKMVYIDAFGEVSPCVFVPMTFGNLRDIPIREIYGEMRRSFPTEDRCFINSNYATILEHASDTLPLPKNLSESIIRQTHFSSRARFFQLHYG
jgi:MoaA/NifB/PqqE/SkfB family radical SAM enzyme